MRNSILLLVLVIMSGCMNKEKSNTEKKDSLFSADSLDRTVANSIDSKAKGTTPVIAPWNIDVTKSYPRKNISLQSIAEVKYIPIETNDSMLWRAGDMRYVRENMIIASNNDCGIMIYDGQGKAKYSFNKRGGGSNEYGSISALCYDKTANELFVLDIMACRIKVYDLKGEFKRSISLKYGGKHRVYNIMNFNENELLAYVAHDIFARLSKKNGTIIEEKRFGKDKEISLMIRDGINRADLAVDLMIKGNDKYIISAYASDTTYLLDKQGNLEMFGVRVPPVLSLKPHIFLFPGLDTPRFYFAFSVKKVWDFNNNEGFPAVGYILDKKENSIYEYDDLTNDDFKGSKIDITHYNTVDTEYGTAVQILKASELVEAREKDKLKGKLKELAANMREDDNPILLVAKFNK